MTRRAAAVAALAPAVVAAAGAVWSAGRGDDAAAARAAYGEAVGEMQLDSHDLAGRGVPLHRVSFRVGWRTRTLATGLRRRTVAMIRAGLAQLAARDDVDPTRIALVGFSRGAAVSALAAAEAGPLAAEVYVSGGAGRSTWPGTLRPVPARSRDRVARLHARIDPVNALAAATARRPRLVQWGTADDVIAADDLERFAAAVRPPRRVERLPGLGHPLDLRAMRRRLDWLTSTLDVEGPAVAGAPTSPPTATP